MSLESGPVEWGSTLGSQDLADKVEKTRRESKKTIANLAINLLLNFSIINRGWYVKI